MDRKRYGKGFPGASNYKSVDKTSSGSNGVCKAVTESGSECNQPQSLKIIDEIHELYADRLQKIDDEAGGEGTQLKIKMLQSWVNDLGEQNAMLVRTVEKLEQEAAERVTLLEDSLQRSSRVALEYMKKLQDYDNEMGLMRSRPAKLPEYEKQMRSATGAEVDSEANEIILSEKDEVIKKLQAEIQELQKQRDRVKAECDKKDRSIADMQAQIKKLQDDVVMKDSQIKGFIQRIQELRDSIAQKSDQAADLLELAARYDVSMVTDSSDSAEARRFELEAAIWKRRVADSEAELLQARTELRRVEHDAYQLQSEIMNVTHKLNESERLLQGALHERNELTKEVASLSVQLNAKTDEIVALTQSLAETEKSAKDVREALTAEVAEKHDQLLALRRDVIHLEEQCRQADMQTHFKDDIIKEMRKDVKLARSKLAILEEVVKDQGYSGDIGQRLLALNELACSLPTKPVSYGHQNRFPSSFAYDPNFHSERTTQVFPYHRVSDSANFSRSHQFCTEKTHHAADLHSAVEKTYRHSNSLRHNLSHDKLSRTRTKSTRTQSQLSRVEEALKQELSKLNDQASCKPHQQHTLCHDVEVVESTTSTRTIGVQYSQQKQARIMVDPKDLEAKEQRILELERALKNVQKDMRKQLDEHKSMHAHKSSKSTDQFSVLKEQLEAMMINLKDRDDKIVRQNVMIEELESRLEDVREDLMQLHTRAEGYLKQMTATQKSHDESQRRISELKETLDTARLSMTGSLSKLQASVDSKDVTKSMDNVLDYQHKAEECQATLTAMKGEIEYLMHNLASREKQIKNLEETVSNLKESLGTAKGEMEKAHRMAMAYLKEKEMVEDMQKKYEENIEDLKRALLACQEEKILQHSEEKEMASVLPDNVERADELLKQDETTTKLLIEAIKDLLDALRHATKAEERALETKKKPAVKFAEQSPEDYEQQIKELQRQLKEAQVRNSAELPAVASRVSIVKALVNYTGKDMEARVAIAKMKEEIDVLLKELDLRDQQIARQEEQLIAVREALSTSQYELSEARRTAELEKNQFEIERAECERKIKALQQDLKAAEDQIKMYKDKYLQDIKEPLPRKIPSDPVKDDRIKELEEMLKSYEQELEEFKEKFVQETKISVTEVKSMATDTADFIGTDEDASHSIKELEEEIARLAAELDSSSVEAMEQAEANRTLKEKLLQALDEMQNLRKTQTKENVGERSNEQKVRYLEEELKAAQEEMRLFRDRLLQQSQVPLPQTDLEKWKSAVSEIVDYRSKDPEANRIITCLEEEMDSLLDALQERDNKVVALYDQLSRLRQEQFEAQNELQKMKREAKLEQIQKQLQSDYDKEVKIQELEDDLEYINQELNLYKGRVEEAEKISDEKPIVEPVRSFVAESVDYRGRDQESNMTINNLKNEITRLLDELNLKNEQIAKEKEMNTTLQERLNQTKNVKQELENKSKLKQTEEQLKNQILEEKITLLGQELKTAEDEMNKYREELTKIPEVTGKKQTLPEVKSYVAHIIDYRGKDEEANRIIADLKAEVDRLLSELNSSNIEVSEQEEINKTLMEELNHLRSDYQRLKKDMLTKQTQTKLELQRYEEKVADLECDLKAALEQVKTYRLKQIERSETPMKYEKSFVAESINYHGEDGEARQKIASLKADIDKLLNELNARNNEVATKEAINKSLQGELNQALDDLSELKQQVREKRIKEESGLLYEQRIAELQKDLQDAKEEIANYIEKIEKAQTAKIPAVEPMKSFVADSVVYHGKDVEARHHIVSLKNEIFNLLDELNTRNAQFATKEDVNKSLRDQLNRVREESKALEREARVQRDQLQLGITSNEQQIKNLEEDLKFAQEQIEMFIKDNLLRAALDTAQEKPSVEPIKSFVAETADYSGSDEEANRNILDLKTEIGRLLEHLNLSNVKVATQEEINKILQTELGSIRNELQNLKEELRGKDSGQQSNEAQEQEYKKLLQKLAVTEEELNKYREQHKQQSEVPAQKPIVALKKSACLQTPSHNWEDEEARKRISALQKEMKSLLSEIYSRDAQIAALICQIDVLQGQTPHQHLEFLNEMEETGLESVTGVIQTMDSLDKDKQIQKLQEKLDAAQKQISELLAQKHISQKSSNLLARSPSIRREAYTGRDEYARAMIQKLQEEIDNLTKELESRDAQNELQERTIDSLRSSLLVAEYGIEDLKRQKDAAEEKVAVLQSKLDALERQSKSSLDRPNILQKKVEDLEAKLADANEIKKVQQVTIDSLRKSIEDNEMEIEALRKSRRPSGDVVKVLQDTVEDLRKQLANQSEAKKYHLQTIDSLRKALDEAQLNQSQKDSKDRRHSSTTSEDEALRNEIANCYETIKSLRDTIQSQKNEIETLKEKEIRSIVPNGESDLKKRLSQRKSVVIDDPKTHAVHELEDRVKWLEKELGIRESMLKRQASDPSKDILKERVGYLAGELRRKSASSLPSDNELLKEQRETIQKLEDTLIARDEQIEKLNDEIIQLSQQQVQQTSGRSIIRPATGKTQTLSFEDENIEKLKNRVKSLEKELADCEMKIYKQRDDHSAEELKKEVQELEKKLVARDSVIKQYKEDKDRLDRKLSDLEKQLFAINKYKDDQKNQNERLLELEKELAVREALIKEHKEDKEKLNVKLKDLENELAICRALTDKQKGDKEKINEKLMGLQKEHNACEALIKQHKENMERLTEKQKGLENELAESKALLKKFQGSPSVVELQDKMEKLKKELRESETTLQKYEGSPSVDELQDKVKDLKDELSARDKMIEDLQEKVKSLQMKLDEQEEVVIKPVRTASCEKMMGELEVLRKELALHSQMNASQVKIIENLQQSHSDTQAELKALQAKSNELEESRRSSTNQIMDHYKLQLQLTQDKLEQQAKENKQQAETIALLQSSLETAKSNLSEVEERVREADRKLKRANEELVSTNERNKEKIEVLEGKVTAREAEIQVLEEKVDLLKNSLEQEQQRVINKIQEADKKLSTDRAAALEICREKLAGTEELLDMKNRENMRQLHMIEVLQRGNTEAIQAKERAEEKAREVENNCYKKLEECEVTVQGLKDENDVLQQRSKELQEALAESKKKTEEYAKQFEDYKAESEAKLKNLKAKISEYEAKIPALESRIRLFARQNAERDAASEKSREHLKAAESELAQYKDKLQKSAMQLGALSRKGEEQQDELEKFKHEVKTLQSALKAKEKVTEDQKEELQIQQETLAMAQNELKELQNKLKEMGQFEEVKNENERLKTEVEDLKNQISQLLEHLSKEERMADVQEDVETPEGYEELKKENDALKEENEKLKQEVQEESEQNKTNSDRLQKLENMLKVQAIEMQRNEELNRLLRMKYEDVVKKNKEMENELTSLNSQVMDFQHQLDLSEERSDMVQRELDACKETLGHMKEKTESLKEMLKEKSTQVTDLAKDCATTRDNMQSLNNEAMMLASDARYEVDTLKQKVQNLQRSLEAANANYQRVGEDARRHQAQLLESANRELKLQMEFTTKENFLLDKLHKTQAENSKMSDVVDLLNRDNQELRTELTEREGQLQATANKLQNLVQDTAKLQKENNKLQEQLQEGKLQEQAQNDELQQKVHMLQLAVMDAKDQCNEAQVQLKEYAAANNQLKATCKNLETENARLKEQLQGDKVRDNKLQEQVKLLQLAAMTAKDKSGEAQQTLREYATRNSQLAAKCKELENELDNLQAALQQKEAITNQLMNERQNMVKNSSELRHINVALRQALRSSRRRETKLLDWPPPSTSQSYYLEGVSSPPPALAQAAESTYWVMSKSSSSLWHNEDENVKKNNLYWKRKLQNTDYYDDSKEIAYQSSSSK